MEISAYNTCEQSPLINELTEGMLLAERLRAQMGPEYSVETKEILLQQIVSSYDKALFILGSGGPTEHPHQLVPVPSPVMPSSPVSTMPSPKSDDLHAVFTSGQDSKQSFNKRKAASACTTQVQVNSSVDGPPADGYSWRKYGQKDILGAKHPRSYYRCTYRSAYDCWATKQVQRSDDDPTVLNITYKGKHTCTEALHSKSASMPPAKQEHEPDDLPNMEYQQYSAMASSFQHNHGANTQNIDCFPFSSAAFNYLNGESPEFLPSNISNTDNFYGSFSTSLISPSTSSSNYFAMSPCNMDTFASVQHQQHNLEMDITEILSACTSATDSPPIEPGFPLDAWSFSPNFQFNNL